MTASLPQVSPRDLSALLGDTGRAPLLLDVRTPLEFQEMNLDGARLTPLDELDAAALTRQEDPDREVVVLCRSGGRAKKAAEKLVDAGMSRVSILDGGMLAWNAAGLPVNRGKKIISLERQVRIAAGLLVLIGVALGTWAHPGFYGLSAFVGAGLVFSGLTDWCGMGLLLARAPWNRMPQASCCAAPAFR